MADTLRVVFLPRAARSLEKIPPPMRARIIREAEALAVNPFPPGVKKLQGSEFHRVRVGDYRIVYEVQGAVLRVLVVRIGTRGEVYRGL